MAPTIVQVDFPFTGPYGAAAAEAMKGLAESIAAEPGLLWKVWTEDAAAGEAGGIYLFSDRSLVEAYLKMHTARLEGFGVTGIRAKVYDVNVALSEIDRAPLGPTAAAQ